MEVTQALGILKPLSDGVNPLTGEEFPLDSIYQHPRVIRALYLSVSLMEKERAKQRRLARLPANAGALWMKEEVQNLLDSFDSGKTIKELAKIHQGTEVAIESKLSKLDKIESPVRHFSQRR